MLFGLELPSLKGLGEVQKLSLPQAAQLLYDNLGGYALFTSVGDIQSSLAPAYAAGYYASQGDAPGALNLDAAINTMVSKGNLSGASSSAVSSALTALYGKGYIIAAPPPAHVAPSTSAAPASVSQSPTSSSAPSATVAPSSTPTVSTTSNNLFHLPSVTPYTQGVGRHKTPPSLIQQWLPVGLVIAGVVLAIGFGSYAGRE